MPKATAKLWKAIGISIGELSEQKITTAGDWGQLHSGARIGELEALFPRLDEAK
jgi:methionyl-tRNA synthetase